MILFGSIGAVVLVALVAAWALRHIAIRHVRRGEQRWATVAVGATLAASAIVLVAAIVTAFRSPIIGIPFTIGALVLAAGSLRAMQATGVGMPAGTLVDRFTTRMSRTMALSAGLVGAAAFAVVIVAVLFLVMRGRF